jgi:FkbM family methyltransferase
LRQAIERTLSRRAARAAVERLLHRFGYSLVRYWPEEVPEVYRASFFRRHGVTVALDVGANTGQWASQVRGGGFSGRLVSVEPVQDCFDKLAARATRDPQWEAHRLALSESDGTIDLHVASDTRYSSALALLPRTSVRPVATETVRASTLDSFTADVLGPEDVPYLKLDTQGGELSILRCGTRTLDQVVGVEVELALRPIYEKQPLLPEVTSFMYDHGFVLQTVFLGARDREGHAVRELDGIFVHAASAAS